MIVCYRGAGKIFRSPRSSGKASHSNTGGLNLKPSGHIETMRSDMSGAAAVIGTLKNAIALKVKNNILFVCAVAENAIGSGSYKPGDVYTGYAGISVEIGNTDAEGRLVLADALAYVSKNYKPAKIIDIATLTGACVIALGMTIPACSRPTRRWRISCSRQRRKPTTGSGACRCIRSSKTRSNPKSRISKTWDSPKAQPARSPPRNFYAVSSATRSPGPIWTSPDSVRG